MAADRLDAWIPDPAVRTLHCRDARASADELWSAAQAVTLADTRTLGRLVRWRIPGTPPECTYRELFGRYPFTLLEQGEHHTLSGLCGRIWTLDRDYPRLGGPEDFRAWNDRGTVRVLLGHWVEEHPHGSRLVSEARVEPVDRAAALRLRALWTVVGRFERLVGSEPLRLAVRRAEARAPARPARSPR